MSKWRQLALELFPELRTKIQDKRGEYFSIYMLLFDLLPMAKEAHRKRDVESLKKIYQFAEWCFEQRYRARDIWNAAATAFYEHLADEDDVAADIPYWVRPDIFLAMCGEFEKRRERSGAGKYQELLAAYNQVRGTNFHWQEHRVG